MNTFVWPITTIDPRTADDRTMLAIGELNNRNQRLSRPEDPVISSESLAQVYRAVPDYNEVRDWLIWDGDTLAGLSFAFFNKQAQEDRSIYFNIIIDPDYRRRGLGRALLAKVYAYARENRRAILNCDLYDRDVAGNYFMERMGGKTGLRGKVNQLDLRELDRGLIRRWIEQAQGSARDFALGIWENHYPDEDLPGLAEVVNEIIRTTPHDDLEQSPAETKPEDLREVEKMSHGQGIQFWTAHVRETATGQMVGMSEVLWHPEQPAILTQLGTVVLVRCRGRGLGRWLKAAMLDKILRELPQARYVRTHNADSNIPMRKINEELGFKSYLAYISWQVTVESVQAYLGL